MANNRANRSPTGAPEATSPKAVSAPVTTRSLRLRENMPSGPHYEVLEDSYLDNVYHPRGAKVVYYGEPGSALKALNDEAKKRKQQVRNVRLDPKLTPPERKAALRALSDDWNGVPNEDRLAISEDGIDDLDSADAPDPEGDAD